jgi:hypothetical protein
MGGTVIGGGNADRGGGLTIVPALIAAAAPGGTFAGVDVRPRLLLVPSGPPSALALCARQYMMVFMTGVGLWDAM